MVGNDVIVVAHIELTVWLLMYKFKLNLVSGAPVAWSFS